MFLCLLVIDQQLAFAAEAARLLMRDAHDREPRVAFAENRVHLLEAAAGRFRVEKIDDGDDKGVSVLREGGEEGQWGEFGYEK